MTKHQENANWIAAEVFYQADESALYHDCRAQLHAA
jgi:hypothetical protein